MKYQDLFSLKNKNVKILTCCLLQILLGSLRVTVYPFSLWGNYTLSGGDISIKIVCFPSEKKSTLKGKNLPQVGAKFFLLE